ncbi:hypothetical protein F4778DRAFT_6758 [Xylariomycetidae sp. FL2044]|nr:hypothetical protein F4778DRAFT_6758 [Xylariomycetidae sp. FL2044]
MNKLKPLSPVLVSSLLLLNTFYGRARSADSIGTWAVSNVTRHKTADNSTCIWNMVVNDSHAHPKDPSAAFECVFQVMAGDGRPGRDQNCGLSSFRESACSGNPVYTVGGGHSDMGFVVMVLLNNQLGAQAYYGFSDAELNAGANISTQNKPAYPV